MARLVEFEVPFDTSYFSAVQLQPRALSAVTWNALARWLRVHLVPFPQLIQRERCGLVVLGFSLEYLAPLGFFDADALVARAGLRAIRRGARAQLDVRFSAGGREVATTRLLLCPVAICEEVSLAAEPRPFGPELLARFHADEIDSSCPARVVPQRRATIERARAITQRISPFVIHRHACEVAEQWSWVDVAAHVESAREALALAEQQRCGLLRRALAEPMRRFDVELSRPYYSFDQGDIVSRAFETEGRLSLVHAFTSGGGATLHGTVVESF
jgi:hypothetical protein